MGWKRLDVTSDAVARGTAAAVKAAFAAAYAQAGSPRNAALFEVTDADGLQFYFSPGGADVFAAGLTAMSLKAASAPPVGARLAVGDAAMWTPGT